MMDRGPIDSWIRRGIAVAAFVVPAAWVVPAGILQKLGFHTYWLTTLIIPCWIFQALVAA